MQGRWTQVRLRCRGVVPPPVPWQWKIVWMLFRGRKIFAFGKADDDGGLAPAEEDNAAGHKKMVSTGGIQTI